MALVVLAACDDGGSAVEVGADGAVQGPSDAASPTADSGSGSFDAAARTRDAGSGANDAAPPSPDATGAEPDAASDSPDSTVPGPDSATPTPDAAGPDRDAARPEADAALPDVDAAPPMLDAAPPEPDAAPAEPDAAALDLDGALPDLDGALPDPDAAPQDPDAGPAEPDAAPPEPDAAPQAPDAGPPCEEGSVRPGETPCGFNARGTLAQRCEAGGWVDEPDGCVDPDECVDGVEDEHTCGWTGEARQARSCVAGRWVSDACDDDPVRMRLLRDVNPGEARSGSIRPAIIRRDDHLCLFLDDGVHGTELWRTDLTPDGTLLVVDAASAPDGEEGGFREVTAWADRFLMVGYEPMTRWEFWTTDCTPDGTEPLGDFYFSQRNRDASHIFVDVFPGVGERAIIHTFRDGWMETDGTPEGSALLGDIPDASGSPVRVGDLFYFVSANQLSLEPEAERELWRTDLTPEGTWQLVDAVPGPEAEDYQYMTPFGDGLLFQTADALWFTDGTPDGTRRVYEGGLAPRAAAPTVVGGRAYFLTGPRAGPQQLRVTEGTPETTRQIAELGWPEGGRAPRLAAGHDGRLYFWNHDEAHGWEPWASDGTPEGTQLVADLYPGPSPEVSNPASPRVFQGHTCAVVTLRVGEERVQSDYWCLDGQPGGAERILVEDSGFALYFEELGGPLADAGYISIDNDRIYRSDGTAAGTWFVTELVPGDGGQLRLEGAALDGRWLLMANDVEHGLEPWVIERAAP